jgi:bifunctional UDP-N-acetylglucosamine pyrophosphorylase/glucosamine-1-phosphate N-acetyltransferase
MKAIVLAAGKSTRTYPLTLTRPKPVLPLLGKPLLAHTLEALAAVADEAILVVGYRADMVRATFGERYAGLDISYRTQSEQRGTADAVTSARDAVEGDFIVINGDDYYGVENVKATASAPGAAVLGAPVGASGRFGVLEAEGGFLRSIIEKPEDGGAALVNTGLYKANEGIFAYIDALEPSPRGELEFTAALENYARDRAVTVLEAPGPWWPVATPRDLVLAQISLWPSGVGNYIIEKVSYINPKAVVGGRSALGAGCEIGAFTIVEASLLLDDVSIGVAAVIAGSVVGEGAVVGTEAVVDGATLGDGVRVGAGAQVTPGSRVWPDVKIPPGEVITGDVKADEKE